MVISVNNSTGETVKHSVKWGRTHNETRLQILIRSRYTKCSQMVIKGSTNLVVLFCQEEFTLRFF